MEAQHCSKEAHLSAMKVTMVPWRLTATMESYFCAIVSPWQHLPYISCLRYQTQKADRFKSCYYGFGPAPEINQMVSVIYYVSDLVIRFGFYVLKIKKKIQQDILK
jgi:hypothetical protein